MEFILCPSCHGRGCYACNPLHSAMTRNYALLEEAAELVQKRCISQNARGVVSFVPPGHEELVRLVAEAIEQGRTIKKPERVAVGPARHRLEFVEFDTKEDNPPVEDGLFASKS